MTKFKPSYLFFVITLYVLLSPSPANSQFALVRQVSSITEVLMGDSIDHNLGDSCKGSFMGGFYATILLNGAVSSPQEEATIVFTSTSDPTKITQIPYKNTENPYLTGSDANKITFIVPHIKDINNDYSFKQSQYKYNISLKIKNQGTVSCAVSNACQISYIASRTPLVEQIFNPVSISGMYHTQLIMLRYANDLRKQGVPFRHIAMDGFKCDYTSNDLITNQSWFNRWSIIPYSCVQRFSEPVLQNDAKLQTRTYSGDAYIKPVAVTHLYGGGYFTTRVLPSITYVSSHSGSKEGGHLLTVKGKGWLAQSGKTYLQINGSASCNIKSLSKDQSQGQFTATCETDASSVFTDSAYIGGQGWKHQIYFGTSSISDVKDANPAKTPDIKTLLFNSEILYNNVQVEGSYVSVSRAFFKAPKSGNYYIWHSGDDHVKVYFSKTPSTIPATWNDAQDLVVDQNYHTGLRSIWGTWDSKTTKFSRRSEQITGLVEDKYYYIEMYFAEKRGADHATIGFEIQNSTVDSPRKLPQVQRVEFKAQPKLDEYKLKLYWGSDHSSPMTFSIKFQNKNSDDEWQIKKIQDIDINSTTAQFQGKVAAYFNKYFGNGENGFVVVKTMYENDDGTGATVDQSKAVLVEFKIHMKKARATPRQQGLRLPQLQSSSIDLAKSQITFTAGQPGLSGQWQLQITSPNGDLINTGDSRYKLSESASADSVTSAIWNNVPEYYYKVFVVRRELRNSDPQESFAGYEYIISYDEYRANVPQIKAINVDMGYGTSNAKTPSFGQETIQPFSDNLFFFPAPYQFFFTPHQKPQINVIVDSNLGACDWTSDTTCDYEFVEQTPDITNFSSNPQFTTLTITGTNFPTLVDDYDRIEWAGRACSITTVSSTNIECTVINPVAGSYTPQVILKAQGKVKQTGGTAINVGATITSVSPNTVNDQGGQVITLTGTGFPDSTSLGTHSNSIGVAGVACTNIQRVSATSMKCTTGKSMPSGTKDIVLNINLQSITSASAITIASLGSTRATVTPTKMNATEKGQLTVTIINLAEDLSDISKYDVKLVSTTHTIRMRTFKQQYISNQNVLSVKYPGAKMGDYKLVVDHQDKGTLTDGSENFRAGAKITNVSILQGSLNGGTQITIQGELFHQTQSIIKVGYNDCIVKGIVTTTQLTCITPPTRSIDTATGQLIDSQADVAVIINLTEDAKCQGDCLFNWKDSKTPKVTNTAWNNYVLTISGSGFGTDQSKVRVELSQLGQQIDSVTDTEIVATLNNLKTRQEKLKLRVRIDPNGYALVPADHYEHDAPSGMTFTTLEPAINVSQGGHRLILSGTGFASDIVGHLKKTGSLDKVCDTLIYVGFTELHCLSNKGSMNYAKTAIAIGDSRIVCNSCSIQTSASSPTLTSITDGGYTAEQQTLNLIGTDFPTSQTVIAVRMQDNKKSKSATINGNGLQINAVFDGGIGFGTGLKVQSIEFSDGSFAVIDPGASIDQSVTGATAGSSINCSFAGGCLWHYSLTNINLRASTLQAFVCDLPCKHDQSESSKNSFICRAPVMATKWSVQTYTDLIPSKSWQNFNMQGHQAIVTLYSNSQSFGAEAFDNDVSNQTGANQVSCYLGLQIDDASHVGTIDSVRYFFPRTLNADKYVGGKFEVSSDNGVNWTTLFEIKNTPTEGWNAWDRITGDAVSGASETYNLIKYTPPESGSKECNFMQIEIKGKVVKKENTDSLTCPVELKRGEEILETVNTGIIYSQSNTPTITSLSQTNISANGGQSVTITGTGFSGGATVTIDGIECTSATIGGGGTTISCTTGKREAPSVKPFTVQVAAVGYAVNQGNKFLYVLQWSDPNAWSGEYPPVDGDSISIPPGQNLVFNIDQGPKLKALIVQGSLLFQPDANKKHQRKFDAEYVFVRGGLLQIGTQAKPYDSYLTITMHGTKKTPQIPIYGNKVIAVREGGVLQMHGEAKKPSWTELYNTADVGQTSLEINIDNTSGTQFNWEEGDVMVLAPTDFDFRQAEQITITGVTKQNSNNRPQVTFTPALKYKHYAGRQDFSDGSFIEMRAELGVLTHKVVYQGDQLSQDNQYGAHIMLHTPGDESVEGRIENIQFRQVGQAFQLGRYPIHFHMIGRVTKSYIKNNAIHHTYNRACTIHGVHYLTIQGNVAYYTMGHTFFIQDAAETKNKLIRNLAIRSQASFSLLNTDQSPSSFWITHPDNIFRDNHAAGSARYGFWFDMQPTAIGPSFDPNICPPGERLGQFDGNVAHSNGRYGLRIFHSHIPRTHPCKSISKTPPENSATPQDDSFLQNPPIVAQYKNFLGYKNNRNAIIAEKIGAVQFKNIKTADNLQAGIETTVPGFAKLDQGFLDGAVIVGFSENAGDPSRYTIAKGIITGQKDTYIYKNVKFHNFDENTGQHTNAAIGTCSHCGFTLDSDGFANTSSFQGVTFNQVTSKIKFSDNRNAIFHDIDGSVSGDGVQRWITPSHPHHQITGVCTQKASLDNASVCNLPVRKLLFRDPQKFNELKAQKIKIALIGDVPVVPQGQDDVTWTNAMHAKYTQLSQNHRSAGLWEVPFVVGQQYNVHWQYGLDWEGITMKRSKLFTPSDKGFTVRFNYTDRRDEFIVNRRTKVENITTQNAVLDYDKASNTATQQFGAHINDTPKKQWSVLVNSKPDDGGRGQEATIVVTTKRCSGECSLVSKPDIGDRIRKWSVASDWQDDGDAPGSGVVPVAGAQVTIKPKWNMVYDVQSSNAVKLKKLFIEGRLTFESDSSKQYELKSEWIIVQTGQLIIGEDDTPYPAKATITLLGTRNQKAYAYSNDVIAGNKILFVTGKLFINAGDSIQGGNTHTKLLAQGTKGSKALKVESGLKWKPGHKIAIAPSGYDHKQYQLKEVESYDDSTGDLSITTALEFQHFGATSAETYETYTYDLRTEVGQLTKNVIIQGEENQRWGGQVFVTQYQDPSTQVIYAGKATLKNVQFVRMSQYDTQSAAFRAARVEIGPIIIDRCSFHQSPAWALNIGKSKQITLTNNVIYQTHRNAIKVHGADTFTMKNNLFIFNGVRQFDKKAFVKDHQVAVDICTGQNVNSCVNTIVQDNIVAGAQGIAFLIPSSDCNDESNSQQWFMNNRAHSSEVGVIPATNNASGSMCGMLKNFQAHHNYQIGVTSFFQFNKLLLKNIKLIDNSVGVVVGIGSSTTAQIIFQDSLVIGEHTGSRDCSQKFQSKGQRKVGVMSSIGVKQMSVPYSYPSLGFFMVMGNASRGKKTTIENVTFKDFPDPSTRCKPGAKTSIFQTHPAASDLIMQHIIKNAKFDGVSKKSFAYLMDPPQDWANLTDCVEFPCTAPQNFLIQFRDGVTDTSNQLDLPSVPFDIIGNNPGINQGLGNCSFVQDWNSSKCQGDVRALIQFESLDSDKMDRSFIPLNIVNPSIPKFNNKLNSFRDHVWDGFYTGQKRLSRFISIVRTDTQDFTEIIYKGTPPLSQLFELYATKSKKQYLKIKIDFPKPEAVRVKLGSVEVPQQNLQRGVPAPLTGANCGENRWIPQQNILEFTLLGDPKACSLTLVTKQSIQVTFRIQMSIEEFYNKNHSTTFVNRLSASLGIETYRIKVVGVTPGSVVVHTQIEQKQSKGEDSEKIDEINQISQKLNKLASEGTALGDWKVLDFTMSVRTHQDGKAAPEQQAPIDLSQQNDGLSIGVIVVIVIGSVVLVTAVVLIIVIVLHRRRKKLSITVKGAHQDGNIENSLFCKTHDINGQKVLTERGSDEKQNQIGERCSTVLKMGTLKMEDVQ